MEKDYNTICTKEAGPCTCPQCISEKIKPYPIVSDIIPKDNTKTENIEDEIQEESIINIQQNILITDDPDRCSKNDNPSIGPCMCPNCMEAAILEDNAKKLKGIVITDEHLVSPNPEHRVAWFFKCPNCQMGNIADYNPRCPDCGEILIYRSQTVFNWVRSYSAQNKK